LYIYHFTQIYTVFSYLKAVGNLAIGWNLIARNACRLLAAQVGACNHEDMISTLLWDERLEGKQQKFQRSTLTRGVIVLTLP